MKRRDFLKLIGVTTVMPSVLAAMPKRKKMATEVQGAFAKKTIPFNNSEGYIWSTLSSECDWSSVTFTWICNGRPIEEYYVE